ncbi:type I restriction-modification system endonuclease [Rhodoferax sediminis]|uniref:type I restriction-modification system endonuclease n=1 Tax=Rhodoferax sediminis TaxID=2509614 RepID=UPI00143CEA3B|nr:type I restriction-modification system endonuclease [Rhodoferax sediminis]
MSAPAPAASANFQFLQQHDPLLVQLCAAAERNFAAGDPNTCLLKLRQFGEALAQHLAAVFGVESPPDAKQADLLVTLQRKGHVDRSVADMLHLLRQQGNTANHSFTDTPISLGQAKTALKVARELAVWFHRAFGRGTASFKPGPFIDPVATDYATITARLEAQVAQKMAEADRANALVAAEQKKSRHLEGQAALLASERSTWEQLAQDEERERLRLQSEFEARLAVMRAAAISPAAAPQTDESSSAPSKVSRAMALATSHIELDEDETRAIIDTQLRAAGWEADTTTLRYSHGARPIAGKNQAIAEWPTQSGPADYVLFVGLTPLAVIEAKKFSIDVSSVIQQAERYSVGYTEDGSEQMPGNSVQAQSLGWPTLHTTVTGGTHYRIPFVFASNGRGYHRQFLGKSGVWFRDLRRPQNHALALAGWHTPEGLSALLALDTDGAEQQLKVEPFGYLNLRDYQVVAVQAIEAAIATGKRECLVAMATGTGKTRTTIGLIYRLLKAKRFNRILFLVDRNTLGEQAQNAFKDARLEQNRLFTDIYDLKELDDAVPDSATKVHVATVQGMVNRLFGADGRDIPIDRYDCVVVDEAHRGYTLDREMGEGELEFRSEADYVSSYRRVLDQFDAVKIALTATPAQHTTQIFGLPVYTYTYREAVIDGWLIDHDPPVRFITQLAKNGIHFAQGDVVNVFVPSGKVQQQTLPDELDFEVDHFNRLVITEKFNQVVCDELAKCLDVFGGEKTLIFCANDAHADLVVTLLKQAIEREQGQINDKTVMKITGRADKPSELVRLYKNEQLPKIAVTVDLLTTGIDVPEICNLVFLRRVRSRILYEQMLGRATRLCPEIDKEIFKIYDAVDLYQALDAVSTMKPVVRDVTVPLDQLFHELADDKAHSTVTGTRDDDDTLLTHADDVAAQIVVRVRNLVRRAQRYAGNNPPVADALNTLKLLTAREPGELATHINGLSAQALRAFIAQHGALLSTLKQLQLGRLGTEQVISDHPDELIAVETGYGSYSRPEDYLDAFKAFITENRNKIAALEIVVTRPRDLTREHLRELQVALAEKTFTERLIGTAWKQAKNEDIAATLIGYIRQLALGSPLVPFEQRVGRALKKVLASQAWATPQQKWLERIAKSVKENTVIDETTFAKGAYANHGGFKAVNAAFRGNALEVIHQFEDAVWQDAA